MHNYEKSNENTAKDCLFCAISAGQGNAAVVFQDESWTAFLDHRPLFHGHCLLVPCLHTETLDRLSESAAEQLTAKIKKISAAVEKAMGAEGVFIAINDKVSQSVPHFHAHIVPRRKGDGLRGFFWPRTKYADAAQMEEVAERIRTALGA